MYLLSVIYNIDKLLVNIYVFSLVFIFNTNHYSFNEYLLSIYILGIVL